MLKGLMGLAAILVIAGPAPAQDGPPAWSPPVQNVPDQGPPRGDSADHESSVAPGEASQHDESGRELSQADLNALADARIGMARSLLQMSPQQEDLWPPIEDAIRNALEVRYRRIARLRAAADQSGGGGRLPDPIAVMRSRGEALSDLGDRLRKLAEAWQPLYQTLTPEQKDRMRLVASHILCETRGAIGCRVGNDKGAEAATGGDDE